MRRRLTGARLAPWVAIGLAIFATSARGGGAAARCRCQLVGNRAQAMVEVEGLVDAELERLIRLGLAGRVRWELELTRKRWLFVEQQVAQSTGESVIRYSEARRAFVIEGQGEVPDLSRLTLNTADLRLESPPVAAGRYELRVRARLQVITVESLAKVASWVVEKPGDGEGQEPASWTTRGLLTAVSNDLQREATTSCRVTPAK